MPRFACTAPYISLLAWLPAAIARAQTHTPSSPTPSEPPNGSFTTFIAPDGSASASLPAGWTITRSAETVIVMTSPSGETINLGTTFIVKDAPYTLHQTPANGIDLSIPNSASLADKFSAIVQTAQFVAKEKPPLISITSTRPTTVPAGFNCATIDGNYTGDKGPFTFRAILCSLPVDTGGTYKVITKFWQAPPSLAEQDASTVASVLSSYRIPQPWLQKKLAPHFAAPVPVIAPQPQPPDSQFECFDLALLRDVPPEKLPAYCRTGAHSGPQ